MPDELSEQEREAMHTAMRDYGCTFGALPIGYRSRDFAAGWSAGVAFARKESELATHERDLLHRRSKDAEAERDRWRDLAESRLRNAEAASDRAQNAEAENARLRERAEKAEARVEYLEKSCNEYERRLSRVFARAEIAEQAEEHAASVLSQQQERHKAQLEKAEARVRALEPIVRHIAGLVVQHAGYSAVHLAIIEAARRALAVSPSVSDDAAEVEHRFATNLATQHKTGDQT